jgi:uncharacterized membrane protein
MTEPALRDSLNALADQALPADLATRALKQGRWMRIRRNVGAGVGALAVTAAFLGAIAGIDNLRGKPGADQSAAAAAGKPSPKSTPTALVNQAKVNPNAVMPVADCTVAVLPVPHGGSSGSMTHTDATGAYITYGNVLWTNGRPTLIPTSDMDESHGVNSHGEVVGFDGHRAWFILDGHKHMLPLLAGYNRSVANGINSDGDIVGTAFEASSNDTVAVIWPAAHPGTVRKLAAPGVSKEDGTEAFGISDSGVVVGTVGDGNYAYMWDANGAGHRLATPVGYTGGKAWSTTGDWASGWAALGTVAYPVRWNLRTGAAVVYGDFGGGDGWDITSTGDLLSGDFQTNSVVIVGGTESTLPLPAADKDQQEIADSMSADGKTISGWLSGPNTQKAVVWHC